MTFAKIFNVKGRQVLLTRDWAEHNEMDTPCLVLKIEIDGGDNTVVTLTSPYAESDKGLASLQKDFDLITVETLETKVKDIYKISPTELLEKMEKMAQ